MRASRTSNRPRCFACGKTLAPQITYFNSADLADQTLRGEPIDVRGYGARGDNLFCGPEHAYAWAIRQGKPAPIDAAQAAADLDAARRRWVKDVNYRRAELERNKRERTVAAEVRRPQTMGGAR